MPRPQPNSWTLVLQGGPEVTRGKRTSYPYPPETYRKTINGQKHEWRQTEVREAALEVVMEYQSP